MYIFRSGDANDLIARLCHHTEEKKSKPRAKPIGLSQNILAYTIQLNFCRPGSDQSGSCNDAAETPSERLLLSNMENTNSTVRFQF